MVNFSKFKSNLKILCSVIHIYIYIFEEKETSDIKVKIDLKMWLSIV